MTGGVRASAFAGVGPAFVRTVNNDGGGVSIVVVTTRLFIGVTGNGDNARRMLVGRATLADSDAAISYECW